jgi:hypothetical protein
MNLGHSGPNGQVFGSSLIWFFVSGWWISLVAGHFINKVSQMFGFLVRGGVGLVGLGFKNQAFKSSF